MKRFTLTTCLFLLALILYGCSQAGPTNAPLTIMPTEAFDTAFSVTKVATLVPPNSTQRTETAAKTAQATLERLSTPIINGAELTIVENEIVAGSLALEPLTFQPVHGSQETVIRRHASTQSKPYAFTGDFENGEFVLYPTNGDRRFRAVLTGDSAEIMLQQDGATIFELDAGDPSPITPLRGLWVDEDEHWTLEVAPVTNIISGNAVDSQAVGLLYQDGKLINEQLGCQEIFGYQLLNGRPFFFFKIDDLIRVSYDGETLPVSYNEVPHYGCCSSAELNPVAAPNWVGFFGKRDGIWYYTEIGHYK